MMMMHHGHAQCAARLHPPLPRQFPPLTHQPRRQAAPLPTNTHSAYTAYRDAFNAGRDAGGGEANITSFTGAPPASSSACSWVSNAMGRTGSADPGFREPHIRTRCSASLLPAMPWLPGERGSRHSAPRAATGDTAFRQLSRQQEGAGTQGSGSPRVCHGRVYKVCLVRASSRVSWGASVGSHR